LSAAELAVLAFSMAQSELNAANRTVNNSLAKLQTSTQTLTISNIYTSKRVED